MTLRPLLAAAAAAAFAATAPAQPNPLYSNFNPPVNADGYTITGATLAKPITFLDTDDITVTAGGAGSAVRTVGYSVANFSPTDTITFRVLLRFFDDSGAGGGPGNLIGQVNIGGVTLAPQNGDTPTYSQAAPIFTVPASGKFHAGIAFDDGGTGTATANQLNQLGPLLLGPPTVGSSSDNLIGTLDNDPNNNLYTSATISPTTTFSFPGQSMAWYFSPVPEPATVLAVAAVALGGWARLRRGSHQPPALVG